MSRRMKSPTLAASALFLATVLSLGVSPAPGERYCGSYPHRVSRVKVKGERALLPACQAPVHGAVDEGSVLESGTISGHWRLVWADFVVGPDGRPRVENVRKVELGDPAFYETHGFSPAGSRLVFSSNLAQPGYLPINNDIFLLDLSSFALTRLTDRRYNDHAHFFPDGRKIAWMTNMDIYSGTDLWIMNEDGSGKERLTFFNKGGVPSLAESASSPPTTASTPRATSCWSSPKTRARTTAPSCS